ncbi:uncharacterized protein B0T23DRAFT_323460 [Neurospora hispaniola]|uniref:Uncharacterized protein n=1 Tax=Neurospora hispaniola TaxID=588809 RepID=A0AAJ0MNY1_9PEZI|nr:hypothetical protein B0T23DRAFT_323460 [Neurospora hispaniola]
MSSSDKAWKISLKAAGDGNKPASKLPFFRFPPEIRFIIYRMAWSVDPKPYRIKRSGQLRIAYLKKQLSFVVKMGAVSHQMRVEAYSEFFHRTQAYFRWNTQMQGYSWHNVQVMAKMQSSFLLKYHLQHVSLYWPENYEHRITTLRWLEGLKQLKTLKIILSNGPDLENRKGAHYSVNAMRRLAVSLARRNANSEKPFVTFVADRLELVNLWNSVDWFRALVEGLAKPDAEPPHQIIEQHLGCLNPLWARSLAFRI